MISFSTAVLQKTWDPSCGAIFGLAGPITHANLNRMQQKIVEFFNDSGTKIIPGVYSTEPHQLVTHFVNPTTRVHAMRSETDALIMSVHFGSSRLRVRKHGIGCVLRECRLVFDHSAATGHFEVFPLLRREEDLASL